MINPTELPIDGPAQNDTIQLIFLRHKGVRLY